MVFQYSRSAFKIFGPRSDILKLQCLVFQYSRSDFEIFQLLVLKLKKEAEMVMGTEADGKMLQRCNFLSKDKISKLEICENQNQGSAEV